jgi:hypothetical protein
MVCGGGKPEGEMYSVADMPSSGMSGNFADLREVDAEFVDGGG